MPWFNSSLGGPIEQILANLEGEGDVFEAISGGGSETAANSPGNTNYVGARGLPPEFIAELEKEFGFDKPPLERFLDMMWNYIRLDFGESYFRSISVIDLVLEKCRFHFIGAVVDVDCLSCVDPVGYSQGRK